MTRECNRFDSASRGAKKWRKTEENSKTALKEAELLSMAEEQNKRYIGKGINELGHKKGDDTTVYE